jgi:L-threonylcarbamoyladenylate synthase
MDKEIKKCTKVLQRGGTILYPTDTIWGIGCDATNAGAVQKIYRLKQRFEHKSLIILIDEAEKLRNYISSIPEIAWDLLQNVDTPLTIIYPAAKNLAENVIADDGTVAIRIVKHEFCCRLIQSFGKPIVSTSANISGENPPIAFRSIDPKIIGGVDYVVSESLDEIHELKPSRIIKLELNGEFRIIRQ